MYCKCIVCDKSFDWEDKYGNSAPKTCSKTCRSKLISKTKSKNKVQLTCKICKKKFKVKKSISKLRKHCSRKCFDKSTSKRMMGNKYTLGVDPWNKGTEGVMKKNSGSFDKNGRKISGKNHHLWKGDNVGYFALHHWLKRHKKKMNICESCGTKDSDWYDWHNISGEYRRDVDDFIELCRKCHYRFDRGMLKLENGTIVDI